MSFDYTDEEKKTNERVVRTFFAFCLAVSIFLLVALAIHYYQPNDGRVQGGDATSTVQN